MGTAAPIEVIEEPAGAGPGGAGLGEPSKVGASDAGASEVGLVVSTAGGRRALLVRWPEGASVGEVAAALADATGVPSHPAPGLHVGRAPLPPVMPIAEAGLVHGALVGLGVPVPEPGPPAGGLEVAVAGGPAAGAVATAGPGEVVSVGRSSGCTLVVTDPEVSRRHATVTVAPDGGSAVVEDAGSRNGTGWQGYRLDGEAVLTAEDVVQVGESVVVVRPTPRPEPCGEPGTEPATVRFNRPPRLLPPAPAHHVVLPAEPEPPADRRFPLAAVLLPVVLGGVMWFVGGGFSPYLLFVALSPLMLLSNVIGDRRGGRKQYRARKAEHDRAMATVQERLAGLVRAEERARRQAAPDPAGLLTIATGPTRRLWERRPGDGDFLDLRIGLADRPPAVEVRVEAGPGRRAGAKAPGESDDPTRPPTARLVPVTVDLPAAGTVGIAGPRATQLALARAVLAQIATLHGPRTVRLVLVTGADDAADWEWTAWLPHTLPGGEDGPRRTVAAGRPQAEARLTELAAVIARREEQRHQQLGGDGAPGERIVVLLDGARRLRSLPGLAGLLQDGPAAGVYALCLDQDEASLPAECRATVAAVPDAPTRVVVRSAGADPIVGVLADGLAAGTAGRLARALAPVRDLGDGRAGPASLPARVRYLDLVGRPDIDAEAVAAGWRRTPHGRSSSALLGVTAGGPYTVDLVADGPHALVAGTTGAGKSELLQTLVASLALGNRPDQLTMVLVDYKGGAAFSHCAELPHCVGLVTDLDGHLAERALASLSAEITRRERLLAEVGAKDIDGYWAATGAGGPPLARLVIVIDEFATLVEEVPEFVNGVVGIGMRGRSLGVHVVLATQRPAGAVSANLRANVSLRLCLRVTDPSESSDVIDAPDAARIPAGRPGRAYARIGQAELTAFQAARVGGARPAPAGPDDPRPAVRALPWSFEVLGRPAPAATADPLADDDRETDLAVLVRAVRAAAGAEGLADQPSPWLPPLPDLIGVPPRRRHQEGDGRGPLAITLGLADLPARQAQRPFELDLERTGSLAVVGAVRSGRSATLRTIAAGLATTSGPDAVHLYAVDGGTALAGLADLPQCGAVVGVDDSDRVERLFGFLDGEIRRRQGVLAAGGFGTVAEQRAAAGQGGHPPLAHVVVLVDRLEAFTTRYVDRDGGVLVDTLERLLREGPGVGVVFVVAGDRTGLTGRLTSAIEHRLVLRQADRDDYVYAGIPARTIPAHIPPGRAFWLADQTEVQVALLATDPSGPAQAAALATVASTATDRWADVPAAALPRRIEPLPEDVSLAAAEARRTEPRPAGTAVCTVAVGGDQAEPIDLDLADLGPGFVVAGPPGSGRSTALVTLVRTLSGRAGGERSVVILAPRPSPLRALGDLDGVLAVHTEAKALADDLPSLLDAPGGPLAVVIDDAERVTEAKATTGLENLLRHARDRDVVVVAAATTDDLLQSRYRGWLADLRRSRSGLLLRPASRYDGEALDAKLPRSVGGRWPAGRAFLVSRGRLAPVQVVRVGAG